MEDIDPNERASRRLDTVLRAFSELRITNAAGSRSLTPNLTLATRNGSVRCHLLFLASLSPVLMQVAMENSHRVDEADDQHLFNLEDVDIRCLRFLVNYLYGLRGADVLPMNHNDDAEQNASAAVSWLGVSDAASALGLNAMWIPTAREVQSMSTAIVPTPVCESRIASVPVQALANNEHGTAINPAAEPSLSSLVSRIQVLVQSTTSGAEQSGDEMQPPPPKKPKLAHHPINLGDILSDATNSNMSAQASATPGIEALISEQAGADGDDIGRMNVVTDDEVQNIAGTSQSNDEDDHDGPLLPALEIQPVAGPSTSRNVADNMDEAERQLQEVFVNGVPAFRCRTCQKTYRYRGTAICHILNEHNTPVEDRTCKVCKKTFTSVTRLHQHTENLHRWRCNKCQSEFQLERDLTAHYNTAPRCFFAHEIEMGRIDPEAEWELENQEPLTDESNSDDAD